MSTTTSVDNKRELGYGEAIDLAIEEAMARDDRVVIIGEEVAMLRGPIFARFGVTRVLNAPISESAFVAAAGAAAMAGLRPIVEFLYIDFSAVAMDALINQIAKLEGFTGGRWDCPLVVRAASGGALGDGGQHQQSLWGLFAAIPGLTVVAPSNPSDAYGLMQTALASDKPVIFLENKLLSAFWRGYIGRGGRAGVEIQAPTAGSSGPVDGEAVPFGQARICRRGEGLTIATLAMGVHHALEAAERESIDAEVIDLRTVQPLDSATVIESVRRTGRLLVVDEDYRQFGLSGELAALTLEAGLAPRFGRVCLDDTQPYAPQLERAALPNVERIVAAAEQLGALHPDPD